MPCSRRTDPIVRRCGRRHSVFACRVCSSAPVPASSSRMRWPVPSNPGWLERRLAHRGIGSAPCSAAIFLAWSRSRHAIQRRWSRRRRHLPRVCSTVNSRSPAWLDAAGRTRPKAACARRRVAAPRHRRRQRIDATADCPVAAGATAIAGSRPRSRVRHKVHRPGGSRW